MPSSWNPQANFSSPSPSSNASWLLDNGASHHVTADLNNLSLHTPYSGQDDVMLGNGTNLPINHIGSVSLTTSTSSFQLQDVLCVPKMQKKLISIALFCVTNNVSIELFPHCFHVKDLQTGDILLQGGTKDGVYEWPVTTAFIPPILAFSAVKTTMSISHQRLGHPASPILKHIMFVHHLNFSSQTDFCCNACLSNKSHKLPFLCLLYTRLVLSKLYFLMFRLLLLFHKIVINTMLSLLISLRNTFGSTPLNESLTSK